MNPDKTISLTDALSKAANHHDDQPTQTAPGIVGADLINASSPLGKPTAANPYGKQTS